MIIRPGFIGEQTLEEHLHDGVEHLGRLVGKTGQGLGLVSIRERTNLIRGTLTIDSVPGQGTTVTVRIRQ